MEILKLLLSFFASDKTLESFSPLLQLLSNNSFDVVKTLKNLNLEAVAPLIKAFMERANGFKQNETPTENSVGGAVNLNPIANVADKQIIYTLNKYFAV